jgi:hypothetical protein
MIALLCLALATGDGHVIQVVDDATGRGVPLVELETTNRIRLVTDSGGVAVFDEPGLMGTAVWFDVRSHGYEHPKDGFGFRGAKIETVPGGRSTLKVKRLNVAERLYRVTGQGIYAETLKAGGKAPIQAAAINGGGVLGQDTVQTIAWKGRLWWFWGDTARAAYPLGQFATSGATSPLPGPGGLDPSVGVDLAYWTDDEGFSRKMVDLKDPEGPVWIFALMLIRDEKGVERLLADVVVVRKLGETVRRGLVVWDETKERFTGLTTYDVDEPLHPAGQPIRIPHDDGDRLYFPTPYAVTRVKADWASVRDPRRYEAFTCLKPGTRVRKGQAPALDRDGSGRLVWSWKPDTGPLDEKEQEALIRAGAMKPEEAWFRLRSEDGERVLLHTGSVCWNARRKAWILVALQQGGKASLLGEVWYAEAAQPWGPFERGVKIVTHDRYTFYNVVQHPEFDQDGGRRIYFEGTYTQQFSGVETPTPRYDYNQIMYRLDLDAPRLAPARLPPR